MNDLVSLLLFNRVQEVLVNALRPGRKETKLQLFVVKMPWSNVWETKKISKLLKLKWSSVSVLDIKKIQNSSVPENKW